MKRKALGYAIIHDPTLPMPTEVDTYSCLHCNKVVDRVPFKGITDDVTVNGQRRQIGGWCYKCDGPICVECARKKHCVPIEQWCEQIEAKSHYDQLLGRK